MNIKEIAKSKYESAFFNACDTVGSVDLVDRDLIKRNIESIVDDSISEYGNEISEKIRINCFELLNKEYPS